MDAFGYYRVTGLLRKNNLGQKMAGACLARQALLFVLFIARKGIKKKNKMRKYILLAPFLYPFAP